MFKFIKKIKDNSDKIVLLQKELASIKEDKEKLSKIIEDMAIYAAIGMPFVDKIDKRIELLIEAKNRGYFNSNNYFNGFSIDNKLYDNFYRHFYSNIPSNYTYFSESDSLYITAIGVKGNFSCCLVCIYKNGEWSKVMTDK